jgi:Uma2 family endonuclease
LAVAVEQETREYTAGMNLALSEVELPVRLRLDRPMTDAELLRFCAVNGDLRIERDVNGELIVMTPAGSESGGLNMEISTDLNIWARADGRGKAFDSSTGFTLPDGSMRNPDSAWLLFERWNALTRADQRRFAPVCPDFVIELRSPSDGLEALRSKMAMWIKNGAQVGWLIDPERKVVEVYRAGQAVEVLEGPETVVGDGPVAGLVLEMARVWQ